MDNLKNKVIEKLKGGKRFVLRSCSMCRYPLAFSSDGTNLFYDSGCDCSWGGNQQRDWSELDFYLEPSHGHIAKLEAFVSENAAAA